MSSYSVQNVVLSLCLENFAQRNICCLLLCLSVSLLTVFQDKVTTEAQRHAEKFSLWLGELVDHLAPEMTNGDVGFLHSGGARGGHCYNDVAQRTERFSRSAGECTRKENRRAA